MKPKPTASASQSDLFKVELISIISLQHPLVKLAALISWDDFERLIALPLTTREIRVRKLP